MKIKTKYMGSCVRALYSINHTLKIKSTDFNGFIV